MKKLLIAGGGTGGHLFPGLAVAEAWKVRGGEVVFVGTERGLERGLVPRYGYPLEFISVSSLKGGGFFKRMKTMAGLPKAFMMAREMLKRLRPDRVLGIGGYASGPLVMMAQFKKIKNAIHEQNATPGMTNKILGKRAGQVFLTFAAAATYFDESTVLVTGNPVLAARRPPEHCPAKQESPVLLVCGGSQGARAINDVVIESLPALLRAVPNLKVIHQTGEADFRRVQSLITKPVPWIMDTKDTGDKRIQKAASEISSNVEVAAFFDNMQELYQQAHLVIARAGAGTLTEISLWGLPAILVPYPFAADNHQWKNADAFSKSGAAEKKAAPFVATVWHPRLSVRPQAQQTT
jgi:UDP-N-acetylglucosamine--N-acetylmuramyl-(pentapeptide) pyrophosphoryl-undecaprenol N-acetylglucosamine transferase